MTWGEMRVKARVRTGIWLRHDNFGGVWCVVSCSFFPFEEVCTMNVLRVLIVDTGVDS